MNCPSCGGVLDLEEDELDEGDPISCDDCAADLKVLSLKPLEIVLATDDEEDEDFDEDEDDDEDEDEDELEEEDEKEEDEWS